MKVFFLNPGIQEKTNEYPAIGALILAKVVKNNGFFANFYDAGAEKCSLASALEAFIDLMPDVLCLSLYTIGILEQYKFLERVKKIVPNCIVIVGGPHATALPDFTMEENSYIDFLIFGEGEETITELLFAIKNNTDKSKIDGICYRKEGSILKNKPRNLISNLDDIPFPDFWLLRKNGFTYQRRSLNLTDSVGVIMSSRGCPAHCEFCFKSTFGNKLRRRSPKNVVSELKWQMEEFGYEEFQFLDDLFAVSSKWLNEFLDELEKQNIKIYWKCLARVNSLKNNDLKRMYALGCYGIEFGVESGNDKILKDIGKNINTQQIRVAFKTARNIGLVTSGFFIFGLKKETEDTLRQTLKFAKEISPDLCGFANLLPFPGSKAHSYLPEELKYDWKNFISYYDKKMLPISLCSLSPEDLKDYSEQADAEMYGSPKFLIKNIVFRKKLSISQKNELMLIWSRSVKTLLKRSFENRRKFINSRIDFVLTSSIEALSLIFFSPLLYTLSALQIFQSRSKSK